MARRSRTARHGRVRGLEAEVLDGFDHYVSTGTPGEAACWLPLWDLDCIEVDANDDMWEVWPLTTTTRPEPKEARRG